MSETAFVPVKKRVQPWGIYNKLKKDKRVRLLECPDEIKEGGGIRDRLHICYFKNNKYLIG